MPIAIWRNGVWCIPGSTMSLTWPTSQRRSRSGRRSRIVTEQCLIDTRVLSNMRRKWLKLSAKAFQETMLPVCYQKSREQCLQQTANHAKSKTERDALLWLHQEPGIEHICMVKSSEAKRNSLNIFVKVSSHCRISPNLVGILKIYIQIGLQFFF